MYLICIIYVSEFLHLYYTYRVPDMCSIVKYRPYISDISGTYRVDDMCPITSILTSGVTKDLRLHIILYKELYIYNISYLGEGE